VSNDETVKEAGAFAKEIKATFPVIHDPKSKIMTAFGAYASPTNLLVGRNGKIAYYKAGEDLQGLLDAVEKQMKPGAKGATPASKAVNPTGKKGSPSEKNASPGGKAPEPGDKAAKPDGKSAEKAGKPGA
jgi:hypothetical protein